MVNHKAQRDIFIDTLFELAANDEKIVFLSADFGAPALDRFRAERSNNFFHLGISEQNMMDVAGGMSLGGLKPFVYAMGPFVSLRCLEQIKCSLAQMKRPVTILSVGNGLGYANAGPTHYSTEDYACLRAIVGLEVWTPSDNRMVAELARLSVDEPRLRCIRLDRSAMSLQGSLFDRNCLKTGYRTIRSGDSACVISNGYALSKVYELINRDELSTLGLIDLFASDSADCWCAFCDEVQRYKKIVVFEENTGSGALGSQVLEILHAAGISGIQVHRQCLDEDYFYENIGRDDLMARHGLSLELLKKNIEI